MKKLLLYFLFLFLSFSQAQAHSVGKVFEEEIGDFRLFVGLNVFELAAGEVVSFNIELFKADESGAEEFTNARINLRKNGNTYLSTNIVQPAIGDANFSYKFPEPGEYELSVNYERGEISLVEKAFVLEVGGEANGRGSNENIFLFGGIGAVVGFVLCMAVRKRR